MAVQNALLFVDHGSRQASANEASEQFVDRLCAQGLPAFVAHMELASPTIAEQVQHIAQQNFVAITVVPLFFSAGKHMREDIPQLVATACDKHGVTYQIEPPILEHEQFFELMLARYRNL